MMTQKLNMKPHLKLALLMLSLAHHAFAAAPTTNDYAKGIRVDASSNRPLIEAVLPDAVYQGVTRADLGDVRVFNADGTAVPHAFCASPQATEPAITQESLPVFEVQGAMPTPRNGTSVEVQTSGGTAVKVQEGETQTAASATQTTAHVIDAREIPDALRSMQFDWESPDGASEAHVRVEASEDLDQWQTVVGASTLLKITQGTQQLQRQSVPLPQRRYKYLRVVRMDGGPPLQIAAVIAERVASPQAIDPLWFSANTVAAKDTNALLFDSARLAPVTYARLLLPQENSSLRVNIASRPDATAPWRQRWSGEVYSIMTDGERRVSPPAEFGSTADRYWQVSLAKPGDVFTQAPTLELGYRPARLRFLAQGSGPFTLAYGSRRAEAAPLQQCDSLLADVGARDLAQMIGEASFAAPQSLGGDVALKPLPKKTPVRLFILWGVLIVGVALLVAMAVSLLKRLNATQPGSS
jgi:hypothetical protein